MYRSIPKLYCAVDSDALVSESRRHFTTRYTAYVG